MLFRHINLGGMLVCLLGMVSPAFGQLGILTATVGEGQLMRTGGEQTAWRMGEYLNEGDTLRTGSGGYAMLFFVSGLGSEDIEFDGTIVVEVDQDTELQILRIREQRLRPIDIQVTRGRVRAFFDAGEHKDFILLSTPQGRMQVTGSIIYAQYTPGADGQAGRSEFGTFDSDVRVTLSADGRTELISQLQKVMVVAGQVEVSGMTNADVQSWTTLPDLNFAAALAARGTVQSGYAERSWVGEYVTSEARLEDVAAEGSANIPSQEPEVAAANPTTTGRTTGPARADSQTRLRSAGAGRSVGDEDNAEGFGRDTSRWLRQRQLHPQR
ncbi:MAG: hypothetical protein HJJLKODD_00865 [Phycisphaerae bacterium]|nr:hypothetical protein [Phycisphaerae bacterium]